MQEIRDELRTHSRYIRDNLIPLLIRGGESQLNNRDMALLRSTLNKVNKLPVTLDLLRFSRIEKALLAIIGANIKWPAGIAVQVEDILLKWEDELGPIHDLRADLWAPGGRLEGIRKLNKWRDVDCEKDTDTRSQWSIEGMVDYSKPYATGHLQFAVGAWWIKAAAAYRDGIIDETGEGITANEHGAYAIVMKNNEETWTTKEGLVRYLPSGVGAGVFKLINTITSDVRGVVRVLRSWKLQSPLAPAAGLRYDGLYRVVGYGVKLIKDRDGKDEWKYRFVLRREPNQASIKDALFHPTADELDDWKDYRWAKSDSVSDPSTTIDRVPQLSLPRHEKERGLSIESGYFSATAPDEIL